MGGIRRGEMPQGGYQPTFTRRRPLGFYSVLGIVDRRTATKKIIAQKVLDQRREINARPGSTRQQIAAKTKALSLLDEIHSVLLDPAKRAAYDAAHWGDAPSTARVQRHRATLTKKRRQVVHAVDTQRKRAKKRAPDQVPQHLKRKRKPVCIQRVTRASKAVAETHCWKVETRSRTERKADRRRGPYVATVDKLKV